jgi:hypothetical protein
MPLAVCCQDLSGIWKGYMEVNGTDMPFELMIRQSEEEFTGYSMTSLLVDGVENIGIKEAEIRKKKEKYLFEDGELVFNNFSTPGKRIILTASLKLDSGSMKPEFNGYYRTRSLDMRDKTSYSGRIYLQKAEAVQGSALMARLQLLKLASEKGEFLAFGSREKMKELKDNPAVNSADVESMEKITGSGAKTRSKSTDPEANSSKEKSNSKVDSGDREKSDIKGAYTNADKQMKGEGITEKKGRTTLESEKNSDMRIMTAAEQISLRKPLLIHEFSFSGDSVDLKFYDNGTVDGDTISVLLNDQLIIAKEQLRTQAIERKIQIPAAKDSLLLTMYAENLGAYPPNTGILVIKDGKSRVEIRFMGDMENNPVIRLNRKK